MVVLSDRGHSYIHMFESNASMLSRVIFYLESVHFLFLFSISRTSSKFGMIRLHTVELAALERLKNSHILIMGKILLAL